MCVCLCVCMTGQSNSRPATATGLHGGLEEVRVSSENVAGQLPFNRQEELTWLVRCRGVLEGAAFRVARRSLGKGFVKQIVLRRGRGRARHPHVNISNEGKGKSNLTIARTRAREERKKEERKRFPEGVNGAIHSPTSTLLVF